MGDPKQQHTYDAIVVGSGISGGWAAKELCEKGLKTLVLERGRNVEHIKDYTTAFLAPWQFPHHLHNSLQVQAENPRSNTNPELRRRQQTLLCQRPGTSLYTGKTIQLDTRLPGRRPLAHLGKTMLPAQ